MGKTLIRASQHRQTALGNFWIGTNIYSVSNVFVDRCLSLNTSSWDSYILRLNPNTWDEGVRLTVAVHNIQAITVVLSVDAMSADSYMASADGTYSDKIYAGESRLLEFVKVGGAVYMIAPPGAVLKKRTWA